MYQDFQVTTIETNIKNKTIYVNTTFDIDPESVNDATVQLYEKDSRNFIEIDYEVINKQIIATLRQWPDPNIEYIFKVQKINTILGDPLISGIRRRIVFDSSIMSELSFTYPAENEVLNDLKAEWKEIIKPEMHGFIQSYYLEISTENAFHNIVKKAEVTDRNNIDLSEIPEGQYYIRGRVQKDNEYGSWSEIITFVIGKIPAKPDAIYDSEDNIDDDEPIYCPDIEIISKPESGETPKSIIIEFDCDIDPESLKNILLIRRSI